MSVKYDSSTRVWSGPKNESPIPPETSLGQFLLDILAEMPDKVSQICADTGTKLTCKDIRSRMIRLAENLKKLGYKTGDIFAIVTRNNDDVCIAMFASFVLGAPIICLHPELDSNELTHMFKLTKPKVVFCEVNNVQTLNGLVENIGISSEFIILGKDKMPEFKHVTEMYEDIVGLDESQYRAPPLLNPLKHIAVILCSAGVTGPPKGVCYSHAHIISKCTWNWDAFHNVKPYLTHKDIHLCFTSLYWTTGLMALIYSVINGRARVITVQPFTAELFCSIVKEFGVTYVSATAAEASQILAMDDIDSSTFSSIRVFRIAGSFVVTSIRQGLAKLLKPDYGNLFVTYGTTEMCGMVTETNVIDKEGMVGALCPGMQAKILGDNDKSRKHNKPGEICLKYVYNFLGYYGQMKRLRDTLDQEGWIHTGDIGYFDKDNNLYVTDRKKDFIKYMNYRISPWDIEKTLEQALGIEDICVVGIEDFENGTDLPAIFIIRPPGSTLTEEDVLRVAEENLPDYKHLRGGCFFVEKFPVTKSGILLRKNVKEIAQLLYRSQNKSKSRSNSLSVV